MTTRSPRRFLGWQMVGLGSVCYGFGISPTFADAMFAYAVLGGIAIGFGTILAAQTLASNWFIRYRARAMALILGGGAVVGYLTLRYFAPGMLRVADWRTGWLVIAGISAFVAILSALFMRGEPERVGQEPDGGAGGDEPEIETLSGPTGRGEWTAPLALRTSQFYVLVGLSVAYGVPWGRHNRLRPPPSGGPRVRDRDGRVDPRHPGADQPVRPPKRLRR